MKLGVPNTSNNQGQEERDSIIVIWWTFLENYSLYVVDL